MRIGLLKLVGYDPAVTRQLSRGDLEYLTWSSMLTLVSALLFACGGACLVQVSVNAGRFLAVVTAVAFIAVFLFVLNLQRMFITSGGFGYHGTQPAGLAWRPDGLRLVCVLFLALLFAQPLLIALRHAQFDSVLHARLEAVSSLYRSNQLTRLDHERDDLLKRTAALDEKLQLLGITQSGESDLVSRIGPTVSARRKALVIGMQRYKHLPALTTIDSPAEIARTLTAIGFEATHVSDLGYDDLLLTVDRYLKSLRPGDISVVYYAGYAGDHKAAPRLLPVDFASDKSSPAIKLGQLMDDILGRSPRASVLLLDNTKLPGELASTGSARITPPSNTVVVAALASPALGERRRASSTFAQALAHQLGKGEAVESVMLAVADEVAGTRSKFAKEKPAISVTSNLSKSYLQLSGIATATQLSLADVANELDVSCPQDVTTATDAVKTCLFDARRLLSTKLHDVEKERQSDVERKVEAYRNSVLRSGMLRERWQMLWSNGWANAGLLLVCVLAMTLGDLLRDLRPDTLRRYELARARLARSLIEQTFANAQERVREALAEFPPGPLPGPRWHELGSYFDKEVAATPIHVPPFQPHGSADDLLDRLAWPAQHVE